jgi:foldase protein PrsA
MIYIVYHDLMVAEKEEKITQNISQKAKKRSIEITFTKKNLLLSVLFVFIVAVFIIGYFYRSAFIVATVNGKPITRVMLWKILEQQGGTQTLDTLITQELIAQEGKKKDISVSQQEIDQELQEIEKSVSAQGLSLEQALASQGMTKEELVEQVRIQKTLELLVVGGTVVTDVELNEAIEQATESGQEDTPELREQTKAQLEQTKLTQAIQNYLATIRQDAEVNILNTTFSTEQQDNN